MKFDVNVFNVTRAKILMPKQNNYVYQNIDVNALKINVFPFNVKQKPVALQGID